MEIKYSKTEFDGYTHRFIVKFKTIDPHDTSLTLYSNSGKYQDLENFIEKNKSEKILYHKIVHIATKEQDDQSSILIDEFLKDFK